METIVLLGLFVLVAGASGVMGVRYGREHEWQRCRKRVERANLAAERAQLHSREHVARQFMYMERAWAARAEVDKERTSAAKLARRIHAQRLVIARLKALLPAAVTEEMTARKRGRR